jgi:hypothetical protein
MPNFPLPNYEKDARRLVSYYKRAFRETADLIKTTTNGLEKAQAESLLNQIGFILLELDRNTKKWCEEVIRQAFLEGQASTIVSIGDAKTLSEAAAAVSFSMLARDTVESLVNDTYNDLLLATKNTERKVKQLVRSVVSDTIRMKAVQQYGRNTMRNEIVSKLTQQGLTARLDTEGWVGIVDKAGRRWNLSTYAEMVVRTKIQQAHIEGKRVESLERNVDLAVISSHGAKDACRHFEGMVISLHGLTPGYRTYDELHATNKIFHPNCQHTIHVIRDISLLPESLQAKHHEKMKESAGLL